MTLEMLQTGEASLASTAYMRSGFVGFGWGEVVDGLGARRRTWSNGLARISMHRRTREKQFQAQLVRIAPPKEQALGDRIPFSPLFIPPLAAAPLDDVAVGITRGCCCGC